MSVSNFAQSPPSFNTDHIIKDDFKGSEEKSSSGSVSSSWCIKSIYSVGKVLHMLRATFLLTPLWNSWFYATTKLQRDKDVRGLRFQDLKHQPAWFLKNLVLLKAHVRYKIIEWNFNSNINYFSFPCSFSQQHSVIVCSKCSVTGFAWCKFLPGRKTS